MNIKHEDLKTKGAFFIVEDGDRIAELTYTKNGDYRIIIDHTEVNESYSGQGLGKKLVYHAAGYAREHQLKVLPLCPYARMVFRRYKDDFQDIT